MHFHNQKRCSVNRIIITGDNNNIYFYLINTGLRSMFQGSITSHEV